MKRLSLFLFASLSLLLAATTAHAQGPLPTRATMPEPVVLVISTPDAELLRPTTGIVMGRTSAGDALVVVPLDFIDEEEALYVLDGGTDLALNGLPARTVKRSDEEGLAVLAVPGLDRRPVLVTFNTPETDHELRLAAWPPAADMARGTPPYWVPVNVAGKVTGQAQTLMPGARVPNLTGPLLDLCGQWAGLVIAGDAPGVTGVAPARVILSDELLRIAEFMDLRPRLAGCTQVAPVGGLAASPAAAPTGTPLTRAPVNPRPAPGISSMERNTLVFLLFALLTVLLLWLLVRRRAAVQRRRKVQRTLQTETMAFSSSGLPERRSREAPKTFQPRTHPPGSTGWLRIEGSHADGRPLRAVTAMGEGRFEAVIGRAGVALSADGPGISRRHAILTYDRGRLTISDLGSRNGTFVNGVRCQKDEVFYVKDEDQILLGAAPVKVRISPVKGPVT